MDTQNPQESPLTANDPRVCYHSPICKDARDHLLKSVVYTFGPSLHRFNFWEVRRGTLLLMEGTESEASIAAWALNKGLSEGRILTALISPKEAQGTVRYAGYYGVKYAGYYCEDYSGPK